MINNKRFSGAAIIGLTICPAYPKGLFANRSLSSWFYQNGGDWRRFGGRAIQQLIRYGLVEEAYQEMLPKRTKIEQEAFGGYNPFVKRFYWQANYE
jgi:hypothetical protein